MTGGNHHLAFSSGSQVLGSELCLCPPCLFGQCQLGCLSPPPQHQHQRMLCATTPDVLKLILPLVYVCASVCG